MKMTNDQELLSLYFDGQLSPPERKKAEQLIQTKPEIATLHRDFTWFRETIRNALPVQAPRNFAPPILEAIANGEHEKYLPVNFAQTPQIVQYAKKLSLFCKKTTVITSLSIALVCVSIGTAVYWGTVGQRAGRQTALIPSVNTPVTPAPGQEEPVVLPAEPIWRTLPVPLANRKEGVTESETTDLATICLVRCQLNERLIPLFPSRFLQLCAEMQLKFKKTLRAGSEIYEISLNREQLGHILHWLEKRGDFVKMVEVTPQLKLWQENAQEDAEKSVAEPESVPKTETLIIRFEMIR